MRAVSLTRQIIQRPIPWLSLAISLFGILALDWNLFPIVYLFWWEIMLSVGAALVRALFALNGKSFFQTIPFRLFLIVSGGVLGMAIIALAIAFSIKGMNVGSASSGWAGIPIQVGLLSAATALHLIFNYFRNGKYLTAQPFAELMHTFAYMVVLLSLLMVLTMRLIPSYPSLSDAKWVAGAVVLVKFVTDRLWDQFGQFLADALSEKSQ